MNTELETAFYVLALCYLMLTAWIFTTKGVLAFLFFKALPFLSFLLGLFLFLQRLGYIVKAN